MAMSKLFTQFEDLMRKIDMKIRNEDFRDLDITNKTISDIKTLLSSSSKNLEEIDSEMFKLSQEKQREYINKIKVLRSDYDTKRSNLSKLEDKYHQKANMNKLTQGNSAGLSKNDVRKLERDAVLDLNKNVDYQQELLNDIGRDLTNAHSNMANIVTEVKGQGETLNRIQVGVKDTETSVKRTDKKINIMQRRVFCQKCLLHILAVMLFLGVLVSIFYKLFK